MVQREQLKTFGVAVQHPALSQAVPRRARADHSDLRESAIVDDGDRREVVVREVVVAAEPEPDVRVALHEADEGVWRRRRERRRRRSVFVPLGAPSSPVFFSLLLPLPFLSVQSPVVEVRAPVPHVNGLHDAETAPCGRRVREDDYGVPFLFGLGDLALEPAELLSVEVDFVHRVAVGPEPRRRQAQQHRGPELRPPEVVLPES